MTKNKILKEDCSYSFRSYFELTHETDEILAEFDYAFANAHLDLPRSPRQSEHLGVIRQLIEDVLPLVRLSTETAKREILVAPVLMEVTRFCHCQLRIEYNLEVNNWLKGTLDYLLRSQNSLIVIEAKRDDLVRGFTQLAVEMIALSESEDMDVLYGVVTMGQQFSLWKFNYC
ncbi:hypothetical protein [Pseudanabaena sp. 'Roaring Creek']|uniref:hypothetical protein n=1 Tax=Pseudanabaena sp. 'Roaring Creek' TaxID=1681830 RepID=UPI0006D76D3A|nr:hypothetical protein [Pseudanabaena sp. 'Roaring Creek']